MIHNKRVVVVMPAYRAAQTLEVTYENIPKDIVDKVILVDDASDDKTIMKAEELGIKTFRHNHNLGYGANQKTCYREALKENADIVIMLHPDYQYEPKLVTAMAAMLASGIYDVVLGSRIIAASPLKGGMPVYKYVANRVLTFIQNIILSAKLSEYHTGFRAFNKNVIMKLPLLANSDDYVFDNEMLTQCIAFGFKVGEISCPARYFQEASSINFFRSLRYGFGVVNTSLKFKLWKYGLLKSRLFENSETLRLDKNYYHLMERKEN